MSSSSSSGRFGMDGELGWGKVSEASMKELSSYSMGSARSMYDDIDGDMGGEPGSGDENWRGDWSNQDSPPVVQSIDGER